MDTGGDGADDMVMKGSYEDKAAKREAEAARLEAEQKAENRAKIGGLVDAIGAYFSAIVTPSEERLAKSREALLDAIESID